MDERTRGGEKVQSIKLFLQSGCSPGCSLNKSWLRNLAGNCSQINLSLSLSIFLREIPSMGHMGHLVRVDGALLCARVDTNFISSYPFK